MTETEWLTSTDPQAMLAYLLSLNTHTALDVRCPSDRQLRLFACACHLANGISTEVVNKCEKSGWPKLTDSEWASACAASPDDSLKSLRSQRTDILRDIVGNHWKPVTLPQAKVVCPAGCSALPNPPASLRGLSLQWRAGSGWNPCSTCKGTGTVDGPCPWLTAQVVSLAKDAYEVRPGRKCDFCDGKGHFQTSGSYAECPRCADASGVGTGRIEDGTLDPLTLAAVADALLEAGADEACRLCDGKGYHEIGFVKCGGKGIEDSREKIDCVACKKTGRVPHPILAALRSPGPKFRGFWVIDLLTRKN